jgi:dihydroflavonol-4-reductase
LGGFLVRALAKEGHEVIALVRRTSDLAGLRGVACKLAYGNIQDRASLIGALQGVSAVFHLAQPGTENVVELCLELKIPRLVHVSSVAAVGAADHSAQILDETSDNSIRRHGFPNYEAKVRAEELVLAACKSRGLDAVVVNPSVIVGAGDARKEVRKASVQAARGKLPFYPEGGLSVVAAEDVVQGIIDAWKKGRTGERYILSGENVTLKEMLSIYAELAGSRPPRHRLPNWILKLVGRFLPSSREGAVSATLFHWYDHSKATKELGFQPRPAREAIQSSIDWMEENGFLQDF